MADESRSVTRQIEHAHAFAERKGWTVADEYVFVDDGISGAEFANRPGFVRMLNALKPRGGFGVLIVSELSRIGREQLETGYAVKQLSQAGVRIFGYLEDKEILLDTPTDKFLMSAVNFASEIEREKARQRVTDALTRKARHGHMCGGSCFGYDNSTVTGPDGRRSHVERRINEAEAAVVVRIFTLCAGGKGMKTIAKLLNYERAPAPRPKRDRPQGWAASTVRVVLFRDAYRGQTIYNRTRKRDQWGRQKVQKRPQGEWITTETPALRIVSDDLWQAAHQRLDTARATYLRTTDGTLWGKPVSGLESRYLLSGLSRCACCGGSMIAHSSGGPRRVPYYTCSIYSNRGPRVCANRLPLPMEAADLAVLDQFADCVLDPDVITGAITDALAELSSDDLTAARTALAHKLKAVEAEQSNLVNAIAATGHIAVLAKTLKDTEQRRAQVEQELAALDRSRVLRPFDLGRAEQVLWTKVDEWRSTLRKQPALARQVLARLIDGRIVFTPDLDKKIYTFEGTATLGNLLKGIVLPKTGESLPSVWYRYGDSNPGPVAENHVS